MANHLRHQIRTAAATLLTGLTTTGPRVYASRVYPLSADTLPALRIYTTAEATLPSTIHAPKLLERRLTLVIEACAQADTALDDTLDAICKEVETALGNAPTLSATAKDSVLLSTEIDLAGEGDQPLGVARMNYEVLYHTAANAPDTAS